MITAIEDVFYYVSDQSRAVTFYTDVLGFRLTYQDDIWAGLVLEHDPNPDPVKLGLLCIQEAVPEFSIEINGRAVHPGATLSLRTTDIDADVARLRDLGVPIVREIDRGPWGAGALFTDPDHNVLMLYQPPVAAGC